MTIPANYDADRQRVFIRELAQGSTQDDAAAAAGYSDTTTLWNLLNSPAVAREVEKGVRAHLQTVYGPRSMRILYDLAHDEKTHPAIRRAAAKDLIGVAGYVPPKAADGLTNDKSIAAMPAEELAALVNKLEGELASRAKDVSAPNAQVLDDDMLDMLG